MRVRRAAWAAALIACVACSTGGPTPVSMPGSVVNKGTLDLGTSAAPAVTVTMGDDWFSPSFVKAAPGSAVTVTVVEKGDVAHTFTIDGRAVDVALSKKYERRTVSVTLPANGRPLVFYCKYHRSVGMQGALYS